MVSALSFLSLPFTMDLWIALLAPPIFFLKKRRMPVCEFRIDVHGIERASRLGTLSRSWDEVKMVRRYRRGYLLMFAKAGCRFPSAAWTSISRNGCAPTPPDDDWSTARPEIVLF